MIIILIYVNNNAINHPFGKKYTTYGDDWRMVCSSLIHDTGKNIYNLFLVMTGGCFFSSLIHNMIIIPKIRPATSHRQGSRPREISLLYSARAPAICRNLRLRRSVAFRSHVAPRGHPVHPVHPLRSEIEVLPKVPKFH